MKTSSQIILLFSLLISWSSFAKNCQETRMGLDIGSGSTKVMVAKVNFCEKKIMEVMYQDSMPVSYNEDLDINKTGKLSADIIEKGDYALTTMITKARTFKPKKIIAVATSVFRKASNGPAVIKAFSKKFKIKMEVITQLEEARIGYLSALSFLEPKDSKNIIIWDIGGGSMQMYTLDKNKKPKLYLGDLASVTFKNMVIEVIQDKDPRVIKTPNPLKEKNDQAIILARAYARLHVPIDLREMFADHLVVGVGGVHSQSVKNQLGLKEDLYTLEQIQSAVKIQAAKSDEELTGDYRSTDVTNLVLVEGFMEALRIKEVKIVNATLLQGVLLK